MVICFFNKKNKVWDYFLITKDEELTQSTAKARKGQMDLESVLMIDLKIQRKDLGKSLESFYQLSHFSYSDTAILQSEIMTGLN